MLLTEAESATARQKLGIGCWFTTGVTSSNMRFYGFHMKKDTSSLVNKLWTGFFFIISQIGGAPLN